MCQTLADIVVVGTRICPRPEDNRPRCSVQFNSVAPVRVVQHDGARNTASTWTERGATW